MGYTATGTTVCTFSVATDKVWNNDQGVRQEETTWHRVTTWRTQAETCAQYLTKGSMVLVTGSVKAQGFIGRDGQSAASLEVNASDVKFLPTAKQAPNQSPNQSDPVGQSTGQPTKAEEDIPFGGVPAN